MVLAAGAVALALAGAWWVCYSAGGSKSVWPHLFYLPVVMAALWIGRSMTLVVSVAAGLLAGPLLPLDVDAGLAQAGTNWFVRLLFFVLVGQLTAFAVRHSRGSVQAEVARVVMRRRIGRALERGHFRLEYQPIVDLATDGVAGVEALIRWDDPVRGAIRPDEFIPDAERADCIGGITRFVLREACRQAARWRDVRPDGSDFVMSVNLSARDLVDPELVDTVRACLRDAGIPPSWLHLEITETALIDDVEAVVAGLTSLRASGARIAIDDFGIGESSLGHLHRFPIDVLKLDRAFLNRLQRHDRGHTLIAGIVALAHEMSIATVAEGIETDEQAGILVESRCDYAQGYFFARPGRPHEIEPLVASATSARRG